MSPFRLPLFYASTSLKTTSFSRARVHKNHFEEKERGFEDINRGLQGFLLFSQKIHQ